VFDSFKSSWAVLKSQPSLLVFPVASGIALLGVTGVLAAPIAVGVLAGDGLDFSDKTMKVLGYLALFGWYLVCTFVIIFFNAALTGCVLQSFAGQQPSIGSGFGAARRRLPQILGWALVAATVGVGLRALQSLLGDKLGVIGQLVGGVAVGTWGVATYFVVPVVVTEGVGPVTAVKRSSAILRRTWGESLRGTVGLGATGFLFLLPPLLAVFAVLMTGVGGRAGLVALGSVGVLYALAVTVVFAALGAIFRAGVYIYASNGNPPNNMDRAVLQSVFRNR
jgi:hypothetical protein